MRGRTRAGRLRLLDAWLTADPARRRRVEAAQSGGDVLDERSSWAEPSQQGGPGETVPRLIVDVGLGDEPVTTVELADAVAPLGAHVCGVDSDEARVRRAQPYARAGLEFRVCSGWELNLERAPGLIRAVNVLRGYPLADALEGTARLAGQLAEGGLLLEGSTDVDGALGCVRLWRRRAGAVKDEGLLFFSDFTRGFAPRMFRDVLPRELRRSVKPGTPIHRFLSSWQETFESGRPTGELPAAAFGRSARALGQLEPSAHLESERCVRWRPPA